MMKTMNLTDLNPNIICVLCRGYLIDPVTVVECVHSFCKTCIVKHVEANKMCPICGGQIHKTRPMLGMRSDKILQNVVYKLVPGLYKDEMERRKKFQEKHEPTKVSKEELEKHFFFQNDKISMSIEYYDPQNPDGSPPEKNNPNRRYLECPGTVKVQHLKKFILMKYELNENFVIDVIYMDDLIPEDYTLIDVAYYYNWKKDAPMKFFYRIFKKNRVLLKRRKRKLETEESATPTAPDSKLSRASEDKNGKNVGVVEDDDLGGRDQSVDNIRSCSVATKPDNKPIQPKSAEPAQHKVSQSPLHQQQQKQQHQQQHQQQKQQQQQPTQKQQQSTVVPSSSSSAVANVTNVTNVTTASRFTSDKKDVAMTTTTTLLKRDDASSKWTATTKCEESKPKIEAKLEDPVKMEVDEVSEDKKKPDPVRELKIISLLGPGKTAIVGENGQKKPETKENDIPAVTTTPTTADRSSSQNVVTNSSSQMTLEQKTSQQSDAPVTNGEPRSSESNKSNNGKLLESVTSSSTTTTATGATPTTISSPVQQQQQKNLGRKPGCGSQILSVINNLAKKQQNLEAANANNKEIVKVPAVIHGQTTITKRVVENGGFNGTSTTTTGTTTPTSVSHHIPSGTTITVKQVVTTISSPKTNSVTTQNIKATAATTSSLGSANVQTPKPIVANGTSTTTTPSSSTSTSATTAIKPKPAVADLRQFRKCPTSSSESQGQGTPSPLSLSRPPIIPQLTLSGRMKAAQQGAGTISTSSPPQPGSHRLPASTSAAGGIATSRPLSLAGSSMGRLHSTFPSGMSLVDQHKALQRLQIPITSVSSGKSPSSIPSSPSTTTSTTNSFPPTSSAVTAAKLPSNRLELKVQQQPRPTPISPFQAAFQSTISSPPISASFYSHLASEAMWKMPLPSASSPTSKSQSNGKGMAGLPKTMNQGICQIPNPSMLTKQQQQIAEHFMMAAMVANAMASEQKQ